LQTVEAPKNSELQTVVHLSQFKQTVTKPLQMPLLDLPSANQQDDPEKEEIQAVREAARSLAIRRSPSIQKTMKKHKPAIKLAQEILAMKWGIVDVDKEIKDLTLQQYLDIYRKTLSQPAIMAIRKLSEVAIMKKQNKRTMKKKGGKAIFKVSKSREETKAA
jgi:hypothetical protein